MSSRTDTVATHYEYKQALYSSHNQILGMVDSGSRALDLGCGRGIISRWLTEKGCMVVGVDKLEPDVSFTEYMNDFISQDLEQPLECPPNRHFDYVIAADLFEHLKNRFQLLDEIAGRLEPGGYLIASTGNIALFVYRLMLLLGRFDYGEKGILDRDHVHLFTISNFASMLEDAGFRIVARRYTPIPFELVFGQRFNQNGLVHGLAQINQVLARLWPRLFAYQVILKAQLKKI